MSTSVKILTQGKTFPAAPHLYGLFFEDINRSGDGGLYPEMIRNRAFEDSVPPPRVTLDEDEAYFTTPQGFHESFHHGEGAASWIRKDNIAYTPIPAWYEDGAVMSLNREDTLNEHRLCALDVDFKPGTSVYNVGFVGVPQKKGEIYRFYMFAKGVGAPVDIEVSIESEQGEVYGKASFVLSDKGYARYDAAFTAVADDPKARLVLRAPKGGKARFGFTSLMPADTYNGHGMRKDLMEILKGINPKFLRFPGGCIVEGTDLETRYQWKNSVGPVENRPLNQNRWEHTFEHRYYPDYFQSYGLGFFEFFQLSEDIGAEPLPIVSVGLACQFQNWDKEGAHVPVDGLQPYIDDCLDLIEFANGPVTSKWGRVRADMGHPAPFNMKYIGVGNEQWGAFYYERLKPFVAAIRAKYPNIRIVGSSGPMPDDTPDDTYKFAEGWKAMKELKADLVDEHYYRDEDWFLSNGLRYDSYDRKGPKVFAGEYACHGKGKKWNHYEAAILEAAFMTSFERNADIVYMTSPAPLFAHVDGWQWRPDQIWYDQTQVFKTVSYYVQQMYATNAGTNVLQLTMDKKPVANLAGQNGLFASAAFDAKTDEVIVKVANTSCTAQPVSIRLNGMKGEHTATTMTLSHKGMDDENSIQQPELITPQCGTLKCGTDREVTLLADNLPAMSFRIYRIGRGK